jgi:hypothetical protein
MHISLNYREGFLTPLTSSQRELTLGVTCHCFYLQYREGIGGHPTLAAPLLLFRSIIVNDSVHTDVAE